jgi:hypothetical protein
MSTSFDKPILSYLSYFNIIISKLVWYILMVVFSQVNVYEYLLFCFTEFYTTSCTNFYSTFNNMSLIPFNSFQVAFYFLTSWYSTEACSEFTYSFQNLFGYPVMSLFPNVLYSPTLFCNNYVPYYIRIYTDFFLILPSFSLREEYLVWNSTWLQKMCVYCTVYA